MANWLTREMNVAWTIRSILLVVVLYYFWTTAVFALYSHLGLMNELVAASPNAGMHVTWAIWGMMLAMVLAEEMLFRFPLCFIARLIPNWIRLRFWVLLTFAMAASVIFGWLHGGWLFVPVQGVLGFAFSLLCLKSGGFNGKFVKPMFVVWLTHALVNSHLFALVALMKYLPTHG